MYHGNSNNCTSSLRSCALQGCCVELQLDGLLQEMLGVIAVLTGGRLADTASHFREAFLRYTSAAGEADNSFLHMHMKS